MITRTSRTLGYAVLAALAALQAAGCGDSSESAPGTAPAASSQQPAAVVQPAVDTAVRQVVTAYLNAVQDGDFAEGHLLVCADVREQYDAVAQTDAGTFGPRFKVTSYTITETRSEGSAVEVRAAQKVTVAGRSEPMELTVVYTMAQAADGWCIARELPAL
ncbi:hypothetical protein QEZ54_01070 [Catellatospora sp. KI3]|uniref:hypothetical protein n=1 Tax=Catellatospora sp. KI3 TaxID=3041620 RepID=UPI002482A79E|nr:hypothetical protein [Catellatospora sp. KI3]MDI1459547.1 hypothetical protein [Catellatospora sp. KI3]